MTIDREAGGGVIEADGLPAEFAGLLEATGSGEGGLAAESGGE